MKGLKIALIAILSGLVIILAVGMVQIMNGRWNPDGSPEGSAERYAWSMSPPELQHTTEIEMTNVTELLADTSQSPVDVVFLPGEGDKLVVEEYFTRKLEEDRLAKISVSGSRVSIEQKNINPTGVSFFVFGRTPWGYIRIYLPTEAYAALEELSVKTSSGDISLPEWEGLSPENMALQKAFISSGSGDIDIRSIGAEDGIQISSGSGDIDIMHIRADMLQISSGSGDQTIGEAAGVMEIQAGSGYVKLQQAKGTVEVSTSSGEITLGEIDGGLNAHTGSGDIEISRISGEAGINTRSGYLVLGEVQGGLKASSSSGNQRIENVGGNIEMTSSSGDQYVGTAGGDVRMESASGTVRVGSLAGRADLLTSSGDISAVVAEWNHDMSVSTSSGDFELELPEGSGVDLKISTSSGSIHTPFDDQLNFDKRGKNANGSVNGGGPRLGIETTSGDILIRGH